MTTLPNNKAQKRQFIAEIKPSVSQILPLNFQNVRYETTHFMGARSNNDLCFQQNNLRKLIVFLRVAFQLEPFRRNTDCHSLFESRFTAV